jgi:hypothetical protein
MLADSPDPLRGHCRGQGWGGHFCSNPVGKPTRSQSRQQGVGHSVRAEFRCNRGLERAT